MVPAGEERERRLNSPEILSERPPPILILMWVYPRSRNCRISSVNRLISWDETEAAARINRGRRASTARPDTGAEKAVQRLFRDFGRRVPERHIQGADGDTPLAVPAGFLVLDHAAHARQGLMLSPDSVARSVSLAARRRGAKRSRIKPLWPKRPIRRKTEADDRRAVVADIRHDGNRSRVESSGRYAGVGIA